MITVVAAALSATFSVASASMMPNETLTQRFAIRNMGSATARETRAAFVFN
jgi:hypothetical protein